MEVDRCANAWDGRTAITATTRSFFRRRGTKHRLDVAVVLALSILTHLRGRGALDRLPDLHVSSGWNHEKSAYSIAAARGFLTIFAGAQRAIRSGMRLESGTGLTMSPAKEALAALESYFGHGAFRAGQEAIVAAVLGGRDVLAVMPTGSGKSIGYQLPAVMLPGVTLVVSPLISLMKDQVDQLNRRGILSGALHSMASVDSRSEVERAVKAGHLRLLYVAPERFASHQFLQLLGALEVARFIVDEAHCVSEWGHDFRPDYRRLREAAAVCRRSDRHPGRPPIAAFTATATPEVRDDIAALLGLSHPQVLVAGFDRPNIFLRVERLGESIDKNVLLPGLVRGRRALVYAATRKSAEAAAAHLAGAGLVAAAYHAGLPDQERTRVQDGFAKGSLRVVCATNAFGMGIDLSLIHI